MFSPALLLFVLPLGLFLLVCGLGMYTKKWPILIFADAFLPGHPGLAATYIGAWMATLPFGSWWLSWNVPVLPGVLSLLSTVCMVIGLVGCFWMPRFMQPAWLKETEDEIKRGEDAYSLEYRRQPDGGGDASAFKEEKP
ncbi:hypothetical protein SAMN04489742_3288 [Arthrobacter crystallopoietes]|uniref:Uncharacterized protein n=2 Tax=Crystallibacter crystallopoietes TaxID=37928 RepID=A0A1H1F6N8_9MICC|nr:hypothetical protein SAMN04489742_3288 [Arthrobacter crystallopoietes]